MVLADYAITLLKAAIDDRGIIETSELWGGGVSIKINGRNFTEGADPRTLAAWKDALDQLVGGGYVIPVASGKRFQVTKKGYDFGDALEK